MGDWGFGRHHDNTTGLVALFHGPPGTGKTLLANCLASLLPDLDEQEALEAAGVTVGKTPSETARLARSVMS